MAGARCYIPAVPLPTLTPEQRAVATARATQARKVRAEICSELKANRLTIGDVVERAKSDEAVAKLRVVALIEAMPGIGKAKSAAIMSRLGIAQSRRVRGLGPQQLAALKSEFRS